MWVTNCVVPQPHQAYSFNDFNVCTEQCPPQDDLDKACAVHDACTFVLPSEYKDALGIPKQWCYCNCLLREYMQEHENPCFVDCVTKFFAFQDCLGVVDKDLVLFNIGVEGLDIDDFCSAQNLERARENEGIVFRSDYRTVDIGALPTFNGKYEVIEENWVENNLP